MKWVNVVKSMVIAYCCTFITVISKFSSIGFSLFHCTKQTWSYLLRVSSVIVTKFVGNCGFGHIHWRNPYWKASILVQCLIRFSYILDLPPPPPELIDGGPDPSSPKSGTFKMLQQHIDSGTAGMWFCCLCREGFLENA